MDSNSLEHLSYSSISSYLLCPRAWKLHYLDKIKVPVSIPLVFGSAFHNAVEDYVGGKDSDLQNAWRHSWAQQLERDQQVDWGASTPEEMAEDGARILKAQKVLDVIEELRTNVGPEPIIEKRIELRVPGVPIPLIGYIDVITADGVPGDFKTAARAWNQAKAQNEIQTLFYLAALNQEGIEVPDGLFRHYVFTKNTRPTGTVFEHRHKPVEVFWLFDMIQHVWRGIEAGVFPTNTSGWKCSPKYCDHWAQCRGKFL